MCRADAGGACISPTLKPIPLLGCGPALCVAMDGSVANSTTWDLSTALAASLIASVGTGDSQLAVLGMLSDGVQTLVNTTTLGQAAADGFAAVVQGTELSAGSTDKLDAGIRDCQVRGARGGVPGCNERRRAAGAQGRMCTAVHVHAVGCCSGASLERCLLGWTSD